MRDGVPPLISSPARAERWLVLISGLLFFVACWVIVREVRTVGFTELKQSILGLPIEKLLLALLLTPVAYLLLTGYDLIAFRYVGVKLQVRKILFAAFVGYAYSNAISMTPSIAARYRLYSSWGVKTADFAKVIFFHYVSTWVGFFAIGGLILLVDPRPLSEASFPGMDYRRWIGLALLLILGAYLWLSTRKGLELRIRKLVLPFPRPAVVLPQTVLAAADWALMGLIPYILIPVHETIGYVGFISAYLLAQTTQIVSHVPGGIGVFEGVMILLLKPYAPSGVILAGLLAYRTIFLILPLGVASLLQIIHEFHMKRRIS